MGKRKSRGRIQMQGGVSKVQVKLAYPREGVIEIGLCQDDEMLMAEIKSTSGDYYVAAIRCASCPLQIECSPAETSIGKVCGVNLLSRSLTLNEFLPYVWEVVEPVLAAGREVDGVPLWVGSYPVGLCECGGALTALVKFDGEFVDPPDYYVAEIRCNKCSFVLNDGWDDSYIGNMSDIDVMDKRLERSTFAAAVEQVAADWIETDKRWREEEDAEEGEE